MIYQYPPLFWIALVVFWLCVWLVFYSYALFPAFLQWMAKGKKLQSETYQSKDPLPMVSVLISAFNEQEVIEEKIHSIFQNTYPRHRLEVLVGSDASDDRTNEIVDALTGRYPELKFFPFSQRRGKGNVVNELYENATGEILILTDANVMLDKNTIYEMVRYFKDERIGLVDSRMTNTNMRNSGISYQEKAYISREVWIKQHESILWGTMMGPFGGCFAIRSKLYERVPKNFLVDDFYINMKILEKGYQCINNLDAVVYEDISNDLTIEYKRKIRIATGNFQNLRKFSNLLWHKTKGLSFCFISHKALRWVGPFFLIFAYVANIVLAFYSSFYFYVLIAHSCLFVLPLSDLLLKKLKIHLGLLRFITHFYSMNLAMFVGFFKSLKTIESNVWKPTKRNQA